MSSAYLLLLLLLVIVAIYPNTSECLYSGRGEAVHRAFLTYC